MENRDFKGVWFPKEIWLSKELTLLEKAIYIEIDSLDNENHCTAGNEYFADFCNCSESKVSKAIKKLKELGMIEIVNFDGRHRKIRVVKSTRKSSKKYEADSQKVRPNNIDNKKINNNKNNTNVLLEEKPSLSDNFLKSSPTIKTKQNKYSKCVSMINDYTTDKKLREALINYLNLLLEIDPKIYANQFKGKLNQLARLSNSEKEQIKIVNQAIQYGWKSFYPLKEFTGGNYSGGFKDNIKGDTRDLPPLEECLVDRKF